MIVVLVTEHNKKIRITSNHPVKTKRGILPADKLNADYMIKNADGEYEGIFMLYEEDYQNKVYNLKLEKPSLLSGNGLSVGDFDYQQRDYTDAVTPVFSEEELLLAKTLKEEYNREKIKK